MNFPNDVKYTKEHEWIRQEGDVAYVGITDYAQEQLGDIVFVDIQIKTRTAKAGSSKSNLPPTQTSTACWMQKHTKH